MRIPASPLPFRCEWENEIQIEFIAIKRPFRRCTRNRETGSACERKAFHVVNYLRGDFFKSCLKNATCSPAPSILPPSVWWVDSCGFLEVRQNLWPFTIKARKVVVFSCFQFMLKIFTCKLAGRALVELGADLSSVYFELGITERTDTNYAYREMAARFKIWQSN